MTAGLTGLTAAYPEVVAANRASAGPDVAPGGIRRREIGLDDGPVTRSGRQTEWMSGHEHTHDPEPPRDEDFWNERYRSSARVWSGNPNPQLVAEIADLEPGRALDVGCGEGADAIWLARLGWDVVATDISTVALGRAAQHAWRPIPSPPPASSGGKAISWSARPSGILTTSSPHSSCSCPPSQRRDCSAPSRRRCARGGTLLVVGHDPSDMTSGVHRPAMPELFYTADDIARLLDASWTVVANEARPRSATTPEGVDATVHDAVLRATRR